MGMRKPQPDKRARLIETTMKLAYKHVFRETSLADIAEAAHVQVGNCLRLLQDQGRTRRGCCGRASGGVSRIPGRDGPVAFSQGTAVCFRGEHSPQPGTAS